MLSGRYLLDFSLLVVDCVAEVSAFCVRREQLQSDGVIDPFGLL